jgi:hypothetical protein
VASVRANSSLVTILAGTYLPQPMICAYFILCMTVLPLPSSAAPGCYLGSLACDPRGFSSDL